MIGTGGRYESPVCNKDASMRTQVLGILGIVFRDKPNTAQNANLATANGKERRDAAEKISETRSRVISTASEDIAACSLYPAK